MNFIHSIRFFFIFFSFLPLNGHCKALFFGDSLTYVYSESYKSLINKDADVFYQVGSGLLNRNRYDWFSAIERINFDKYDLVIISIGTNDFNKEINSIDYSRSIFELIGRIRSKNMGEKYTVFLDEKKIRTDDGIHITKHGANLNKLSK
ncbi:SGNH/GDSL hydrolase family protein [Xenorhabdus eapokensis]|uniref:SGNH hydrolase-type esterase domain-containing protein n=1 Tax=Xenorhabdus eapokensis TaxID=1873482 RepID=A0A1Q5THB5_9GAMM|nr:SGNH/GDSL hydrolase family protein [Xenorhabdus eapokensis]OKO99591.1 hypothetical protein Xedl_03615 [Xenorhabdus eapokensis]